MWPFRKSEDAVINWMKELDERFRRIYRQFNEVHNQLDEIRCGIKCDHYPRRFLKDRSARSILGDFCTFYIFECQGCRKEIVKSPEKLTTAERKALIALGYTELKPHSKEKNNV